MWNSGPNYFLANHWTFLPKGPATQPVREGGRGRERNVACYQQPPKSSQHPRTAYLVPPESFLMRDNDSKVGGLRWVSERMPKCRPGQFWFIAHQIFHSSFLCTFIAISEEFGSTADTSQSEKLALDPSCMLSGPGALDGEKQRPSSRRCYGTCLLSGIQGHTLWEQGGGSRVGREDRAILTKIHKHKICPYVYCLVREV